jgi:hypothetical protein
MPRSWLSQRNAFVSSHTPEFSFSRFFEDGWPGGFVEHVI